MQILIEHFKLGFMKLNILHQLFNKKLTSNLVAPGQMDHYIFNSRILNVTKHMSVCKDFVAKAF